MNVLITGSNKGIGFGLVQAFLKRTNARVIALCRNISRAEDLRNLKSECGEERLLIEELDLTNNTQFFEVKECLQKKGINSIDILIANAATSNEEHPIDNFLSCRRDELVEVFNTNVGGNMMLLQTFHDMLASSTIKLALVMSSIMGSLQIASQSGGTTAYRVSKAGINMMSLLYAKDETVKNDGCSVLIVHPGHVDTQMGVSKGQQPKINVEESTNKVLDLVEAAIACKAQGLEGNLKEKLNSFEFKPSLEEIKENQQFHTFLQKLESDNFCFVNYDGSPIPF